MTWPQADRSRDMGLRNVLVYCAIYHCMRSIAMSGDQWPYDLRLSDVEPRFICTACGKRGADVRPDFNWDRERLAMMGYR
jgi:hypothetical protein